MTETAAEIRSSRGALLDLHRPGRSSLLPGQPVKTPAGHGIAVVSLVQFTLEAVQNVVNSAEAGLFQGRELALHAVELDPDNETDRSRFVSIFCERFNIKLGEEGLLP